MWREQFQWSNELYQSVMNKTFARENSKYFSVALKKLRIVKPQKKAFEKMNILCIHSHMWQTPKDNKMSFRCGPLKNQFFFRAQSHFLSLLFSSTKLFTFSSLTVFEKESVHYLYRPSDVENNTSKTATDEYVNWIHCMNLTG